MAEDINPVDQIAEIPAPETPQTQVSQPEVVQTAKSDVPGSPVPDKSAQESFRYLREDRDRLRDELNEIRRALNNQQQQRQAPVEDEEISVNLPGEYDSIESKHLAEMEQKNKLRWKREEEKRLKLEHEMRRMSAENRVLSEVPNYKQILTEENINKLEKLKPALARSIASNSDPYEMRIAAIDAISSFVLEDEKTKLREAELKAQNKRVEDNSTRPIPTTTGQNNPSSTPLSKAHAFATGMLTEDRKKELWRDYMESTGAKYLDFKK